MCHPIFCYGYLPEWFDRDRDADAETRVYTAVGEAGEYAGLEADPRGLVAAARSVLAHAPADSPQARDAAQALALLASHGIAAANTDDWPFLAEHAGADDMTGIDGKMESDGKTEHADKAKLIEQPESIEKTDGQSDVVTLSPSAVDSLWACPVCWMLENRFAGPRMGSAATSFGSLIHAVAQQATEAGLDLPQNHTAVSDEDNIDEIAQWMISRYKTLRGDLNAIDDPEERYKALGKDAKASVALRNIATYFVKSNRTGYPSNNTETHHRGNIGPCRSGTGSSPRDSTSTTSSTPTTPSTATLDLPRRTHRHHGRARRRLAGNRHERTGSPYACRAESTVLNTAVPPTAANRYG